MISNFYSPETQIMLGMPSLKPQLIESITMLKKSSVLPGLDEGHGALVWVEGYGCSASISDSEMISGLLQNAGYRLAKKQSEAELNLIVTCSVKDATEHKMVHRIKKFTKSGKPLVVAGCLPKADRAKVEELNPSASLLGPHSIDRTVEVVGNALSGQKLVVLEDSASDKVNIPKVRLNPAVSIIEIASGCLSECTFCQTKLAKGWLRSYRTGDIMRQIKTDVGDGCKEVWLSSTDNGCYGMDIGTDLVGLLNSCCSVEGDFKIRVGMMNPMYIPSMVDRMVETFYKNERIFKFLHIPVQSGSDRVLRKMKRGHTSKIFEDTVKAFRQKMPEFTISTDVIVGFPSETEEDFQKTVELLERTEPDVINLSRYSARPGTESAKLKHIDSRIVKDRTERLHKVARRIAKKRNSIWNEWKGEIIIDEASSKVAQGRNYAYKSIVLAGDDYPDKNLLGQKRIVKVFDYSSYSLRAKIAS